MYININKWDWLYLAVISTLVVHTGPSISTGVGKTFIHFALTVTAHITSLTHTLVCVVFVDTPPCVLTHHVHRHTWSISEVALRIQPNLQLNLHYILLHFKRVAVKLVTLSNLSPLFLATVWQDILGMSQYRPVQPCWQLHLQSISFWMHVPPLRHLIWLHTFTIDCRMKQSEKLTKL